MKDRAHDEAMAELFKQNPAYAVELLSGILEDGEHQGLWGRAGRCRKGKPQSNPALPNFVRAGKP
jgi:DNA-binding phage protein